MPAVPQQPDHVRRAALDEVVAHHAVEVRERRRARHPGGARQRRHHVDEPRVVVEQAASATPAPGEQRTARATGSRRATRARRACPPCSGKQCPAVCTTARSGLRGSVKNEAQARPGQRVGVARVVGRGVGDLELVGQEGHRVGARQRVPALEHARRRGARRRGAPRPAWSATRTASGRPAASRPASGSGQATTATTAARSGERRAVTAVSSAVRSGCTDPILPHGRPAETTTGGSTLEVGHPPVCSAHRVTRWRGRPRARRGLQPHEQGVRGARPPLPCAGRGRRGERATPPPRDGGAACGCEQAARGR